MQLFGISTLVVLALQGSVHAVQTAITCTTTADCAWGETCVAGDSDTVVQACVPPTVCGGSSMGNCPSDDTGKLACLWRPFNDCSEGCAILNGNKGIYKCVSISRCDAYYGGSSCSDGCSVNGVRCNGQGSCNMMSSNPDGTPVFGCTCENGYSGEKCETAPGSTTKTPKTNSSSTDDDDDDSFWGALQDGSYKFWDSDDSSADGSDGDNKDDSTATDDSADTDGSSVDGSDNDSAADTTSDDSSTDASGDSTTDTTDDSASDNADDGSDSSSTSSSASSSGAVSTSDAASTARSGIRPGVLILVLVMAAFFLVGTVLLVAYSRRRKQQEEEDYENALASTHGVGVVGERDLAAGHTGRTPRSVIATM
ncbi:hypothetical protein P3T76_002397 [Phytophthora citrophthora]|uniref:EGF-like domain-containing protein n=1 Tax=Phytophthora citrophthora TaxID=4793 RepID=A0AAD9GYN1_9STRA|nr:hypothetical protein P3T76_002397 [Phytophthora citrophthora]